AEEGERQANMNGRQQRVLPPRRILVVAILAIAAAVAIVVRLRLPVEVEFAPVDRGPVVEEVLGVGAVESDDEVRAAFTVTGRLVDLQADEGDQVRTGDTLGSIDLSATSMEVETARAGEREADAAILRAVADRDKARAALKSATRERIRAVSLAAAGALSQQERDAAVDRETLARSDFAAREATLAQELAAREVAKRMTVTREARAADRLLSSPIDGIVVRRHVDPGVVVTAGMPVLTLVSTKNVRVRAWV